VNDDFRARWQRLIAEAQRETTARVGRGIFDRIRYGDDVGPDAPVHCRDCHVTRGQYHVPDCCVERCPKCRVGQAISCDCAELDGATVH